MHYLLLIYQNPEAWSALSDGERQAFMHAAGDLVGELTERGEWVGGAGLAGASEARSTHVRDGVVTVTDGPFLEAKEALAGYCIVDVASRERAEEIAARWPDAQRWGMEIRAMLGAGEG